MIFSDEVRDAIYMRKKEINKTMIILSKLLERYGMETYQYTAERLILERDDKFLREHILVDFISGGLFLDYEALKHYRDILQGFITEEEYELFLKCVKAEENIRGIQNQALRMYQSKSILGLIKTIWKERKNKHLFPSETAICIRWSLMELFSRTGMPRIYLSLKSIPYKIRLCIRLYELKKYLYQVKGA